MAAARHSVFISSRLPNWIPSSKGIFKIETLEGLDFFHGRFAQPTSQWNPPGQDLPHALAVELANMEKKASQPTPNIVITPITCFWSVARCHKAADQTANQPRPKLTLRSLRP